MNQPQNENMGIKWNFMKIKEKRHHYDRVLAQ